MKIAIVSGIVVAYLACCVVAYLIFRNDWKKSGIRWDRDTRGMALLFSSLGPLSLIISVLVAVPRILAGKNPDAPAKW